MTGTRPPALELEGLDLVRSGVWILRDVSLSVGAGEVLAVLGGAGAGKSALVEAIGLGEGIRAGGVRIAGRAVDPHDTLSRRRAGLACAFETPPIVPGFSVADHLALGRPPGPGAERRLERVLALLPELAPLRRARLDRLPLGLRRLADLGRALAAATGVLVVDRALADFGAERIRRLAEDLRDAEIAVLLADRHIRPALQIADRGLLLVGGRVVLEGHPLELLEDERVFAACVGDVTSAELFADAAETQTARSPAGRPRISAPRADGSS